MSTRSRPRSASAMRPGPTSSPASRSTRPKVTMWRVRASLTRWRPRPRRAPRRAARRRRRRARASKSSWYFSTAPSVCSTTAASSSSQPSAASACVQSIVSATPGALARSRPRRPATNAAASAASRSEHAGHAQAHDLDLALERRVGDPVEQAAALERVVQLARAVGGEDDRRAAGAASMVPISGIVIWKSESTSSRKASNSSSARSISSISRTTGSSEAIASSSGRRMRKSGPKSSCSSTAPSCAARMCSSWRA